MNPLPLGAVGLPPTFLHELPRRAARCWPDRTALVLGDVSWTYAVLDARIDQWARALIADGMPAGARVALYLDKQLDGVAAALAISRAGGVLVPINPLLKTDQVAHILADCGAWALVTQAARIAALPTMLPQGPALCRVIVVDDLRPDHAPQSAAFTAGAILGATDFLAGPVGASGALGSLQWHAGGDDRLAAIFYTSGSTGRPKGVMLSHRNMVAGAVSVASYLGNHADDVLLAVLPLSFDAGFSQLTTAWMVGAQVVLLNYLLPMDVVRALDRHAVTGITAVPPLYGQISSLTWPAGAGQHLRYWANTGGRMPGPVLRALQDKLPQALPFLMYGLTEAFRSTFLPPDQVSVRPDSMGRAIPNAEVLVLRPDGTECDADEPGELVHCGPLVALGYWNRPEATAERFKPLTRPFVPGGSDHTATAVFSGDRVRRDAEGYLYFVGREDEMIKTSGYRVSPTEIEEVALSCPVVREALAFGEDDALLGQVITLVVAASDPQQAAEDGIAAVMAHFRQAVPAYMVPRLVHWVRATLPRTPNGKLDRQHWRTHARI